MTVLVVGNATVDVSFEVDHLPEPGETLLASARLIDAGGKGLNQAIVAHRAGARVVYVAPIGDDADGDFIRRRLSEEGLDTGHLLCRSGATDQSIIYLAGSGENSIVSTAAMAKSLEPGEVSPFLDRLAPGDVLLMQGNLRRDTTEACLARARTRGARTLLNPAPISFDYAGLWPSIDVAVVNEVESRILSGLAEPPAAARRLIELGAGAVVATLGAEGALLVGGTTTPFPAPAVDVIDTTGAGDVFCGVLAAALARGRPLAAAVPHAVAAASLSVTRRGTSSSFPTRADLADLKRLVAAKA